MLRKIVRASFAIGLALAALPATTGGQPPAGPFRARVELIEIPVVVRDRDGRFVSGLTQNDFQVTEHDVVQTITAFDRISLPVAHDTTTSGAAALAVPQDVSTNENSASSRIYVIVLDAWHVAAKRTTVVRTLARRFIEQYLGPRDVAAVISPGGLAAATQDFTSDKARLVAAVEQFSGSTLRSAAVEVEEEEQAELRGGMRLHDGKDPSDDERTIRARALTNVLEALARQLGRAQGRRKALLLFSEGSDYDTTDVTGVVQRHADEVVRATQRAVVALMAANVSVYATDPRGLTSGEGDQLESPLYRRYPSFVTGPSPEAELARSLRALREMSEATGGFAGVNGNDANETFARIVDDTSNYYLLGYVPAHPLKPGEFRPIAVRVSRPDVTVVARKGYGAPALQRDVTSIPRFDEPAQPQVRRNEPRRIVDPAADTPASTGAIKDPDDVRALLASPIPLGRLPMRIQAIPSAPDGNKTAVQIVIEVLGRGLRFAERGSRFDERVELALLTVDDRAKAANGRSATLDLHPTREELQRVQVTGVRWLSRLELAPGHHQIRVAGRAAGTGTNGMVTVDVDVPRFEPGRPAMSGITVTSMTSLLMITRGEGPAAGLVKTPPSAARTFVAGDRVDAAVEVSFPDGVAREMQLVATIERPDGSTRILDIRQIAGGQARPRRQPVTLSIDTSALPIGRAVLRVVLDPTSGPDRIERSTAFEVVSPGGKDRR
jgi:VWFA-related protein